MLYIHATSWFCWAGKQQEQEESHLRTITVLSKHAAILELILTFDLKLPYGTVVLQLLNSDCYSASGVLVLSL